MPSFTAFSWENELEIEDKEKEWNIYVDIK